MRSISYSLHNINQWLIKCFLFAVVIKFKIKNLMLLQNIVGKLLTIIHFDISENS